MKFVFLILNYNTFEETVCCVQSIESLFRSGNKSFGIVIVDNNSSDDSVIQLTSMYKDKDYKILEMEDNLGFSKANNAGYLYIKNNHPDMDFLVVCNSDIEFKQIDFFEKVNELYRSTHFDILGPDVYAPSQLKTGYRGHQSPTYPWEYTRWYTQYNIMVNSTHIRNTRFKTLKKIICIILSCIEGLLMRTIYRRWRLKPHNNTSIHGSCMIFSKKFTDVTDKLFYPETKFYFEELILYLNVKKRNKISVYSPQIQVIHWQGRASKKRDKNDGNNWKNKYIVESGNIYLKLLK